MGEKRSDEKLAQLIVAVGRAAAADRIICTTEGRGLPRAIRGLAPEMPIIVASADAETRDALDEEGWQTLSLSLRASDRYDQVRHLLTIALRSGRVAAGELVVCALGSDLYRSAGDFVVLLDVDQAVDYQLLSDLANLADGVGVNVLEAVISLGLKIGRVVRRGGKRIGAIFLVGDVENVLRDVTQLVPNPFHGHDAPLRTVTNHDLHDALIEFAKLDGAFVVRGDGFIETAGAFLATTEPSHELPSGLGTRHAAAAAMSERASVLAIVVSATDGNVRLFFDGQLKLKVDPTLPTSVFPGKNVA